jgi:hypothetical protein
MKVNVGIFDNRQHADAAVDELQTAGFDPQEISIVVKEGDKMTANTPSGDPVAQGTVSGATTGGIIGGIAGLLIGIGAITIPGIGAVLIGGPLAAAFGLAGAAATTVSGAITGILAGGIVGALVGLGVPEETARTYENRLREGSVLLAVSAQAARTQTQSRAIMEKHGASQIETIDLNP